jgi:hypothetical protein
MDHHFQAPLAEADGVSTSSAKPEILAVQYWTIAERKAAGQAGYFGDRSDRALFYCVRYHFRSAIAEPADACSMKLATWRAAMFVVAF